MAVPRPLSVLLLVLAGLVQAACTTPSMRPDEMREPELVEIHAALVRAVEWARTNPEIEWYSGWSGNVVVNSTDEKTLGLCYEWQELVWDFAHPVARSLGWKTVGIGINVGTFSEHHAVVVYDPRRVHADRLLQATEADPAYVLDAWRNGEPDVYPLAVWVDIPILVMTDPELEDLLWEYGLESRFIGTPATE